MFQCPLKRGNLTMLFKQDMHEDFFLRLSVQDEEEDAGLKEFKKVDAMLVSAYR